MVREFDSIDNDCNPLKRMVEANNRLHLACIQADETQFEHL